MTSPHGKGVGELIRPSVMLLAKLAKSVEICDGAPSNGHSSLLCKEAMVISSTVRVCFFHILN